MGRGGPPPLFLILLGAFLAGAGCSPRTVVAIAVVDAGTADGGPSPDVAIAVDVDAPGDLAAEAVDVEPPDTAGDEVGETTDPALVGYWPMDEGTGVHVGDASGHGNHGVLQNGDPARVWVPGRRGMALNLLTGTWVQAPPSASIDTVADRNAFTIAAWVHARSFTPLQFNFIVSQQVGTTPFDNFGLALLDGRPAVTLFSDYPRGPRVVPLMRWVHLAATFDGTTAKVYIDGALGTSQTVTRKLSPETRPLLVSGNQNDSTGVPKEFFDGAVDEVRLYNRALTAEEIAVLAR